MTPGDAPGPAGPDASLAPLGPKTVLALAALLGLALVCGFSTASATNFGGYDEWLILSLTSEGLFGFPYANRPLALLWALPGTLGLPSTLAGYLAVHLLYLLGSGLATFALARRLGRGDAVLALVAAAAATVWVPLDAHRLNPLNNVMYSGATFAAMLALVLFVEWATGQGPAVLLAGLGAAFLASRSYEGTLGLLVLGAPVLLLPIAGDLRRPWWKTLAAWEGPLLVLAALALLPLAGSKAGSYQTSALQLDASVSGVLGRLLAQLEAHLVPLLTTPPGGLGSWRVAGAVSAFVVAGLLLLRGPAVSSHRRRLGRVALSGLALAVAGWAPMLLTAAITGPARMQGFSAPGVGLLLGAGAALVAGASPPRWRAAVALALGCWIVGAGTARTGALQANWDGGDSYWPAQSRLLRQLVGIAPGLDASTMVVLVDADRVFQATFPFRHAVKFLYEGRALGALPDGHPFLYPARFDRAGMMTEPWPVIREPWHEPATRHGYDEIVVVRHSGGRLELLEQWPSREGGAAVAGYAPRLRILGGTPPARAAILGRPGAESR